MRLIILFFLAITLGLVSCDSRKNSSAYTETIQAVSEDSLLNLVEYRTFNYFWEGAEPTSGAARERIHVDNVYPENDKDVITIGGTGFGIMCILAGVERGFISRAEAAQRLEKLTDWLGHADRFHGAWPHWLYGKTGKVKPFSPKDDGADIVETAYLAQGLLCARQYFKDGDSTEQVLSGKIDSLWRGIEWDWFRHGKNVLYWHWSPVHHWEMNFPVEGYNECLILYVMAASSPTHGVPAVVYRQGWARNGAIKNNPAQKEYGFHLSLRHNGAEQYGGPLFWEHYSYLGLNPHHLKDRYADYWQHNTNHVLINRAYCIDNPHHFKGYGKSCWGLTASYSIKGYEAHSPANDLSVISPTAALASFPYTPQASMMALKHFYYDLGDRIWGPYGFYDAFSENENWYPKRYLAIDQGPEVVMIENYRSSLLWNLFMSCPEVQVGLDKLGFTYK